jgi:hypothetical protein
MNMESKSVAGALAVCLHCATGSAAQTEQSPAPTQDATIQRVRVALLHDLADPMSAQIIITKGPWHGTVIPSSYPYPPGQSPYPPLVGDVVCAQINAKNDHGAYVGFVQYLLVFTDNGFVSRQSADSIVDGTKEVITATCGEQ